MYREKNQELLLLQQMAREKRDKAPLVPLDVFQPTTTFFSFSADSLTNVHSASLNYRNHRMPCYSEDIKGRGCRGRNKRRPSLITSSVDEVAAPKLPDRQAAWDGNGKWQ